MLTKPLGLDPSYTGFGVSCGNETIVIKTEPFDGQTTSQNCQRRCQQIIANIVGFVNENYKPDDILCIILEGPAFGSNHHGFENGWLFGEIYNRLPSMINRPCTICEVPPKTLKKWIAGNGNADKDTMKAAVKERWGVEFELDKGGNRCDAFALYKYGVSVIEGETEFIPTARRGKGKGSVRKKTSAQGKKKRKK